MEQQITARDIVIPSEVLDTNISVQSLKVYLNILSYAKKTGYAVFGNEYLATLMGVSPRTIRRYLEDLKIAKLIKVEVNILNKRKIYPLYLCKMDVMPTEKMANSNQTEEVSICPALDFEGAEPDQVDNIAPTSDDNNLTTYNNILPTVSFINTNSTVLPKLGIIPRSNINIITKDNNTNITAQNFDEQNLDAFTFLLTVVKDMQTTMEQMNDNIIFLNRRIIQNDTNTTEDGVVENAMDAVKPTPPVEITGKPLAKAKKDRGSGDGQTIEQQIKNMPKPKETKAVKMKRWNEENWYRLFADPEAGNTDAMRMMRIILVKYPEIMSITNYLKLEDADLLLKQYELEDISYALSYLNGFAGRNKYDNVLGAIQAVIANKKSWGKK